MKAVVARTHIGSPAGCVATASPSVQAPVWRPDVRYTTLDEDDSRLHHLRVTHDLHAWSRAYPWCHGDVAAGLHTGAVHRGLPEQPRQDLQPRRQACCGHCADTCPLRARRLPCGALDFTTFFECLTTLCLAVLAWTPARFGSDGQPLSGHLLMATTHLVRPVADISLSM